MSMCLSEIVESNVQFASVWKVLIQNGPQTDLTDRPGITVCWADSPFPFWNALFLTEQLTSADILRDRIADATTYMHSKQYGGLLYLCEDYLTGAAKDSLQEILVDEKLEFALPLTGMVGDILPFTTTVNPFLSFRRASNEQILQDFADMNSEAYGFPLEAGRAGLAGSLFWKESAFAYVGYVDNRPVSAAAAIVNDGLLYLALVATRPEFQRRGFAETTIRHALSEAYKKTGLQRTLLHATDAGAPVYQRLGYHRTTNFMTYKPIA
jgi:GNAT superfamily N-acetyltransferase